MFFRLPRNGPHCGPSVASAHPPAWQPVRPEGIHKTTTQFWLYGRYKRWRLSHRHADCTRFRLKRQKYPFGCGCDPQIPNLKLKLWRCALLLALGRSNGQTGTAVAALRHTIELQHNLRDLFGSKSTSFSDCHLAYFLWHNDTAILYAEKLKERGRSV